MNTLHLKVCVSENVQTKKYGLYLKLVIVGRIELETNDVQYLTEPVLNIQFNTKPTLSRDFEIK